MALLLVVGIFALAFIVVCAWGDLDSRPPIDPTRYEPPRHVRVLDDQEPKA